MDPASVVRAGTDTIVAAIHARVEDKKNKMANDTDRSRENLEYRKVDQVKARFAAKDVVAAQKAEVCACVC